MPVKSISKKALEIQSYASCLQSLSGEVSECETNLVIRMAATGIGSHEVLTLLLADDTLGVLNGRLSLSMAFLERAAQQMEDELSLSTNVGPHAAAFVFGANATSSIAGTADEVITPGISATNNIDDDKKTVVRRQSPVKTLSKLYHKNFDLGKGFGVGAKDGLNWRSNNGRTSLALKPTYKGGLGVKANFDFKSSNGRSRFNVNPYYNPKDGPGVNFKWTYKLGRG
ncbi:hypothetical protein V1264_008411 [Littorina saxatilis]|uniref:Uncharacterized protein n=2 Tax=Littorina saxatilis TaxID=31220 RepID=A0AAN9AT53_9CAEN